MKLSQAVKPISYLKAHAAEVIREVTETGDAVVITQNGAATAVLQDVRSYEEMQETLALLKVLSQGRRSVEARRVAPAGAAFRRVRERIARG